MGNVAVKPLDNYSGDESKDYFADGMTDELITRLSQVSAFQRVISRSTMMKYKLKYKRSPKSAREIARELDGHAGRRISRAFGRPGPDIGAVDRRGGRQNFMGRKLYPHGREYRPRFVEFLDKLRPRFERLKVIARTDESSPGRNVARQI